MAFVEAAGLSVELVHAYVGCERVAGALAWGQEGLTAYGAHHSVVIYDVEDAKILTRLIGHTGRVNCVCWLPSQNGRLPTLLSGSGDTTVILWQIQIHCIEQPWVILQVLKAHEQPVISLSTLALDDGQCLALTGGADERINVWAVEARGPGEPVASEDGERGQPLCSLQQCIASPGRIQHSIAVTQLSHGWLLLALGELPSTIGLYLAPPGQHFHRVARLDGHQDWIRSLAFGWSGGDQGGKLLLASGAQDRSIRLWSFEEEPAVNGHNIAGTDSTGLSRYVQRSKIVAADKAFTVRLEGLLIGHEDWVHSVSWQPQPAGSCGRACLLSASMDRTMAVWRPDPASGLWMSEESAGDAGPSNLGYFGGVWSPAGDAILAHGYSGALHLWQRREGHPGAWFPEYALGGHFGSVVDLEWAFEGRCLVSASTDQTARIVAASPSVFHGRCNMLSRETSAGYTCTTLKVHGHDFSCLACIPPGRGRGFMYASGSEEKVIRILEAPQAFLATLAEATGLDVCNGGQVSEEEQAFGAAVPALGLSNKAVYASDGITEREGPDLAPKAAPAACSGRPLEEHLQQSTLWPEVYKAYGHGSEVHCMAVDPAGQFLASACKAQVKAVAAIWLWRLGTWAAAQHLAAHTLTVTQLAFTPDGARLVSVSRDRSICIWQRSKDEGVGPFQLHRRILKAHGRIIWAVACACDSSFFVSGARDNVIKLWNLLDGSSAAGEQIAAYDHSVHSLALTTLESTEPSRHLLAVGLEDGTLRVLVLELEKNTGCLTRQECIWSSPSHLAHATVVRCLCWRDNSRVVREKGRRTEHLLASAGDDHAVHVYRVMV